jgi:triacylglycerol esterase/lipase EstA (alpha/beta hydrolase family)
MPRQVARSLLAAVIAAVLALSSAPPAGAATGGGVNDWSCRPSAQHPRPVVLLHGLSTNAEQNWAIHGPRIAQAGYCTFALTYSANVLGQGGQAPVVESAIEIEAFIDRVLTATGADRVDLVGHSLGAFLALYVTKVGGYAAKVDRVVGLAPPTHGTTLFGALTLATAVGVREVLDLGLGVVCVACVDLLAGGPAVTALEAGPIAQPGVTYTLIASRFDAVVTPSSRGFVLEPGVRNYYVQDRCPLDPVGHFGMGFDPGITSMILNGLDPTAPVRCGLGPPV